MIVTNIRIEPPSDRPSPLQILATSVGTGLSAVQTYSDFFAPYRFVLEANKINRMIVKGIFG